MADFSIPEYRVQVDQLQPGVFIRIKRVNWFNHPFLFNSFKIASADQVDTLKKVGITEVICVPEKSDVLPLSPEEVEMVAAQAPEPEPQAEATSESDPVLEELWRVKRERAEKLRKKREAIARCEEEYSSSLKVLNGLINSVQAGHEQEVLEALRFVKALTDRFLNDTESTIHLMSVMTPVERTSSHALNVAVLSMMIGQDANMKEEDMISLGMAALFHDLGKQRIDKRILKKRGPLNKAEQAVMMRHPVEGVEMLKGVESFPRRSLKVIGQHHERMNGSGYPKGLEGTDIDVLARIVAVADTYDNLCNSADSNQSLTPYQALSQMFGQQKDLFDDPYLMLFIRCLGVYPPGTVVQLSNGAIGMVMSVNPHNQLSPNLVLYDADIPKKEALIVNLTEEPELTIEKSIRLANLPPEIMEYLNPRAKITYFVDV